MNDARHDELIDHGFGSRSAGAQTPDVIAMGPVQRDIEVVAHQPTLVDDEVPPADAWEQALLADPDEPPPIAGLPSRDLDLGVPEADAWEQAQLVYDVDDY
jgi:hypothetical protein